MARPRKSERPGSVRERIVEVASELFAERGYADTSLAEIGRRVGIRAQSIGNHFASKEELYDAVVTDFYRRQIAGLGTIGLDADAEDSATLLVRRFGELSVQDRNMVVTITAEALVAGRGAHVVDREFGPLIDMMVSTLGADTDFPSREVFALFVLGMVFALDAPRLPPATRALRDHILGDQPRMIEVGQLLLRAVRAPAERPPAPPDRTTDHGSATGTSATATTNCD